MRVTVSGSIARWQVVTWTDSLVVVGSSPTRPTREKFQACSVVVAERQTLEDEREVHTAHIRALLRLTPAERCARMVEVANAMLAIRGDAQTVHDGTH